MKMWIGSAALVTLLGGCSLGNVAPAPVKLDLGSPVVTEAVVSKMPPISLPPFSAASVLHDRRVIWRIGAQGEPKGYATFAWVSPPAQLVRERLFEKLSMHGPVLTQDISADMPQLRVTLMQFEQVYALDGASNQAVVSLQAVLIRDGRVQGQFRTTQTERASSNTAPAGAVALRQATDQAANELVQWVITKLN